MIYQYHPDFPAKYSGKSSLSARHEGIASYVVTLFVGYALTPTTELFFDGEMAAGGGLSTALGLGGFTNLDVVRNPSLGSDPYPARFFLRQIIPLSHRYVDADRGHLAMATRLPTRGSSSAPASSPRPISSTSTRSGATATFSS